MVQFITDAFDPINGLKPVKSARSPKHRGLRWTFYIYTTGAVIGCVAALAALIMQIVLPALTLLSVLMIGGLILSATNATAAYEIKKFSNLQDIDEYADLFDVKLQQVNREVIETNKITKVLLDVDKRLNKSKNQYRQAASDANKVLDVKVKKLQELTDRLEKLSKKLKKNKTLTEA